MQFDTYRTDYAVRWPASIGPLHVWRNGFYVSIGRRVFTFVSDKVRREMLANARRDSIFQSRLRAEQIVFHGRQRHAEPFIYEKKMDEGQEYHARIQRLIKFLDDELPPKAVEGSSAAVGQ